jgi:hypothetical protein
LFFFRRRFAPNAPEFRVAGDYTAFSLPDSTADRPDRCIRAVFDKLVNDAPDGNSRAP